MERGFAVGGYAGFLSGAVDPFLPKLQTLLVNGQVWDETLNGGAGDWTDAGTLIYYGFGDEDELISVDPAFADRIYPGRDFRDDVFEMQSDFEDALWALLDTALAEAAPAGSKA